MQLTRREFQALLAGGLIAAPVVGFGQARPTSRIAGVRVGAQSYSFRDRSLDATVEAMASIGLSYCELWQNQVETRELIAAKEGEDRRVALRRWRLETPLDHFQGIRRKFSDAGITITAYNISFNDSFTDEEIARAFEMTKALGADVITSSGTVSSAVKVGPHASKAGMTVGYHNHSRIAPNEFATPDDFLTAMKASDRIAINLDIGHFTAANFDALAFLDEHHARIVSLHIKDRKRDQGATVPFGEGDAPIVAVLQRLRDRKWDIPAQIEYEYRGTDTVAEVKKSLDYCRKALEG